MKAVLVALGRRNGHTDMDRQRHDKCCALFAEVSSQATMMDDGIPTTVSISDQADCQDQGLLHETAQL
jgi:hypothetical protein